MTEAAEHIMDSGTSEAELQALADRIEVSPFLELTGEYGSPVWIRKSSIIAVKGGSRVSAYRSSFESGQPGCRIFTAAGEIGLAHEAMEVMEALGVGEL